MLKNKLRDIDEEIKKVTSEIELLEKENALLEIAILKKKLLIEKIQLEQMR